MKNKKGFTFVEVITVITIITIMTAVSLVYLGSARTETKLKAAQREVASAIKLAQSYALNGKACFSESPNRYIFSFAKDTGNYRIDCIDSGMITHNTESVTLDNGVKFSDDGWVAFTVPNATVSFIGAAPLTINLVLDSTTKSASINSQGLVTEN